jgi:hypothetical protein
MDTRLTGIGSQFLTKFIGDKMRVNFFTFNFFGVVSLGSIPMSYVFFFYIFYAYTVHFNNRTDHNNNLISL